MTMTESSESTGALSHQSRVRRLDLGEVRLTYVIDGAMGLLPAVFFPDVPADHWNSHPESLDAHGRVAMSVGGLLVEREEGTLLIDAGFGPFTGHSPAGPINSGALLETLGSLGVEPADIDAVAFTHLHVDHTGWAFTPTATGTLDKTFPEARYLVASEEWAPHKNGHTVVGASPAPVITRFATAATLVADDEEVFPGVRTLVTPGHSPGHTTYVITSSTGHRLVVFGDAFHIPAQLAHPEWSSRPDADGTGVLTARRRLLKELDQPNTSGFAFHFGDQAFGRLVRDSEGRPAWEPLPTTLLGDPPRELD
ncbi:MBL fold metallo-hydrolase [Actinacidiphila guanduensis]|jgi:glyoxylase-like metal-dependent hydrolase (beta-lactamase superfamily II)|uniref:Glyoxylase, beta-lactamase superfamily II n=1 Tax=Actinacidiphila guanduensis TaxID=310781 RepID=A0A1H0PY56_9ACTN|nr:MBL fold metallo-hydrolase [Actinacidiphila guanduensis]SDP09655.1 Glyoxylase, beta-lactamase superfamily II [Actinacidiphila guanduensis]